jgi:hypothetical protein
MTHNALSLLLSLLLSLSLLFFHPFPSLDVSAERPVFSLSDVSRAVLTEVNGHVTHPRGHLLPSNCSVSSASCSLSPLSPQILCSQQCGNVRNIYCAATMMRFDESHKNLSVSLITHSLMMKWMERQGGTRDSWSVRMPKLLWRVSGAPFEILFSLSFLLPLPLFLFFDLSIMDL